MVTGLVLGVDRTRQAVSSVEIFESSGFTAYGFFYSVVFFTVPAFYGVCHLRPRDDPGFVFFQDVLDGEVVKSFGYPAINRILIPIGAHVYYQVS